MVAESNERQEAEPQSAASQQHLPAVSTGTATATLHVERRPATSTAAPPRLAPDLTPVPGLIDLTSATPEQVVQAYLELAIRGGRLLTAMRQKEYGTIQNERIAQLEWAIQHVINTLTYTDATSALPDAMYCLGVLQRVLPQQ